jgi:pyruvate formate lyase activating enzyme
MGQTTPPPPAADVADGSRIGFVHSSETTSAVNGPGLRYTVFLSGCPLRCLYCHNPDTQTMRLGERTTARHVIEETGRYRAFLSRGGGLTVTGGEPLLQAPFVEDLFVGVKQAYGMHTTLDTSASGGHRATDNLLAHTDLVLLDIKAGNPELYERVSGGGRLSDVLDFGARLVEHQVHVWVRFVLVPGLTDGPEEIAEIADLAADLGGIVDRVEVLPHHRLGVDKYAALGRQALTIFRERDLNTLA